MSKEWLLNERQCERCGVQIIPSARDRRSSASWRSRRFCSKSCASRRDRSCSVDGCDRKHREHGMCDMHRQRMAARGATEAPPRRESIAEKLSAQSEAIGDCIEWTGQRNNHGYGQINEWRNNRRIRWLAHRAAVVVSGRILRPGDVVMHTCDNPPCVNPAHLKIGTQKDNIRDALAKGRLDTSGLSLGWERAAELPHGTYGAIKRHSQAGEPACAECRKFKRARARERRAKGAAA